MSDNNETLQLNAYNGGPTELDNSVEAFIKDAATKFQADEVETAETPAEPAVTEQPNTVETPAVEVKPEDRGMERLVEREVALRTRDQELSAREARLLELETRLKGVERRVLPEELLAKFEYEPEKALEHLGIDPEQLVRQVIANRLGDSADPSVKQTIESAKIKKEMAALRAQLHEQQQRAEAQAFVAQVNAGAREYVSKGVGEYAPTVATIAKVNPDKVFQEIMGEISRDANEKMTSGRGGDVLSYEEAAKRVETRWSEFKTYFAVPAANPAPASTQVSTATSTGAQKPTPPATKPPAAPLAPWLQKVDVEEEGLKAAMAEYHRLNNTTRR